MVDLLSHGKPGPESFPALAPYTAEELSPMPHILQAKLDEMHAVLDGPNSDEEGMRLRGVISELFRIFHELSHSSEWIEVERKKPEFHKMNETTLDQEEFIGFEITSEMKLARTQAIQDARTWNDLNRVGEDIGARDRAVIAAMEFTLRELTGGRLVADGNVGTMRSEQALPGDAIQVDKEHDQMEKTWNSLVKRPLVLRAKL
jgi:arsenate reductase-like glutaredoxin family protein